MNLKDLGKTGEVPLYYHKRPIVENCVKISVSSFVRKLLLNMRQNEENQDFLYDLSKEQDVKKFVDHCNSKPTVYISEVNNPENRSENQTLRITYTKSNLGKGFIFWFVCNGCGSRRRDLYATPYSPRILCRKCHRLSYRSQNASRDKEVARLIRNPELMELYVRSNNLKKQLKAFKASLIIEEAEEAVRKEVENLVK